MRGCTLSYIIKRIERQVQELSEDCSCCRCAARVLEAVAEGSAELMVASHNQETVALATRRMHELGLQPSSSGKLLQGIHHIGATLWYLM